MIELNSRRLNGTIPLNINKSPINLCFLDLGNNFLSGPLPSFSGLSYLQSLYLSYNNFTSIPHDCFRGLENFELLELSYNTKLSPWTIPTNLNSNSRLTVIILETTNLIGSLPDIIDSFSLPFAFLFEPLLPPIYILVPEQLHLHSSRLFSGLENLELLDLSYNTLDLSHQLEYQVRPNRHHTRDYKPHRLLAGYL
ncbi:hypothetical protein HN51_052357 [Arachis hypogaea]